MADITARLIWYKLGEAWAGADVLDIIFLGWCTFGLAIVILAKLLPNGGCSASLLALGIGWMTWARNFYYRLFADSSSAASLAKSGSATPGDGETCRWLNTLVTWYFLNRGAAVKASGGGGNDDFVNAWLAALNQAMARREGLKEKTIVFEEILVGSLPPKILYASAKHCHDTHNLLVKLRVHAEEIRLKILLPNSPTRRTCEVTLTGVNCRVISELRLCSRGFSGSLRLAELPEACAAVRQLSGSQAGTAADQSDDWIARQVVGAIAAAVTEISSAPSETASTVNSEDADAVNQISVDADAVNQISVDAAAEQSELVQQKADVAESAPSSPAPEPTTPPPRPPPPTLAPALSVTGQASLVNPVVSPIDFELASSSLRPLALTPAGNSGGVGRRLLVKVVKAGGLQVPLAAPGGPAASRRPEKLLAWACVELDKPQQRHETGGVYGSTNPYWDQHFVFSLSPESSSLSIRVLHQSGSGGGGGDSETLLGSASLPLSLLPPTGARVLQPLRPPGRWPVSSSQPLPCITLELLFIAEAGVSGGVQRDDGEQAVVAGLTALPTASTVDCRDSSTASSSGVVSSSSANTSGSLSPADALVPQPVPQPVPPPPLPLHAPKLELTPADAETAVGQSTLRSSSLSRVVDEFMTSPDMSYQMSSFSESTLNGGESRGSHGASLTSSWFLHPNSLAEFSSLGRKPKGQKPSRTGSVASRIKRVFSGRSKRDLIGTDSATPTVADDAFLTAPNALRRSYGGPSGTNGEGRQQATPPAPAELGKSRSRGLSASFRRLFSSKKKQRRTSESVDSERQRQQEQQAVSPGPAPTFYSLQKPGKPPRMRPWDSDEIL